MNTAGKEASEKDVRQKKVSCFVFFSFRVQGREIVVEPIR